MNWKNEWKSLLVVVGVFIACFYLPIQKPLFQESLIEAFSLVKWYAREHVMLCLVPAFFIAGAISVFISQESVMKYLGAKANKFLAYGVASVSGTILAVCSCTVLPLFAGIYRMGAGLGPATAFLYSGPAINILAIALTARVLGLKLGLARAVGAIAFSVIIGLAMHLIFLREEKDKAQSQAFMPEPEVKRPLWKNALYFASMAGVLIFANWAKPEAAEGVWHMLYSLKWFITAICLLALIAFVVSWFNKGEVNEWFMASWVFAKQILPLLFAGVFIAGFLLGSPGGGGGIIPGEWVSRAVGGDSLLSNFTASIAGAFMYFATLTEVPILQGLIKNGMGNGPALALLLAGPALSLPNMLVIRSIMGTKKTLVYISLVVVMSAFSGYFYGMFF